FSVLELAQAISEGTMTKAKLLAAGVLVAGVLGLSGTASVLAQRPLQTPPGAPPGQGVGVGGPAGIPGGQPPDGGPIAAGGFAPGQPPGAGVPGMPPGAGGPQGPGPGGPGGLGGIARGGFAAAGHWDYKVEAMPGSRAAFVELLQNRGNEGWEY